MEFQTTHKLAFEVGDWPFGDFHRFRIGTCHGLWRATDTSYDILAIDNQVPGNGHFNDVIEWFEQSCRRDKKSLMILEVWNQRLAKHFVEKRGFTYKSKDDLIKRFQ